MKIDWSYPEPRKGLAGMWDRLTGPGATTIEAMVQIVPAIVAAFALPLFAIVYRLGWNPIQLLVAGALALDMTGGVIGNAASSVKRFWHRKELNFKAHMFFVAIHAAQLFLVAWLFRGMDWQFFQTYYIYLILAATIILKLPLYLQRPVATGFYVGAILINCYCFKPTVGFEWFIPLFFMKLLISHLLREEPYRPDEPDMVRIADSPLQVEAS